MADDTDNTRELGASELTAGAAGAAVGQSMDSVGVTGSTGAAVDAGASEHNASETGEHNGKQSASTGMSMSIPGGGGRGAIIPIRTSERAREVAAIRWSRYRQSAADAVARAVAAVADADDSERIRVSKRGDVAAYGAIAGKLAERAYMDADPRSADFVRRALGADTGAPERTSGSDNNNYHEQGSADLAELLAAYRAWKSARAVAGDGNSRAADGDGGEGMA